MSLRGTNAVTGPSAQTRFHAVLSSGLLHHTKNMNVGVGPGESSQKRARGNESGESDLSTTVQQTILRMAQDGAHEAKNIVNQAVSEEEEALTYEKRGLDNRLAEYEVRIERIETSKALISLYFESIDQFLGKMVMDDTAKGHYRLNLKEQLLTLPLANMKYYKIDYLFSWGSQIPVITSLSHLVTPPEPYMMKLVSEDGGMPTYKKVEAKTEYPGLNWQQTGVSWFYGQEGEYRGLSQFRPFDPDNIGPNDLVDEDGDVIRYA